MKCLFRFVAVLAVTALAGCAARTGAPAFEKTPEMQDASRVRVAVFVDCGARSNGQFRWLQLTALSPELAAFPVDAEGIRQGVLKNADLLVMPGGYSVTEAKQLGADGREAVRRFVHAGGGWIGTCAGSFIACQSTADHPDMLGIVPYTTWCPDGQADLVLKFTGEAAMIGQKSNTTHRVQYSGGPVMESVKANPDQKFKTVAVYHSNIQVEDAKARDSMAGRAAMVAGTYGKGRVFVSAVHPEVDPNDHDILRGAFKYVTGREITWKLPQRQLGQLALGVVTDDSVGVASGRLIQKLIREQAFDVTFVNRGAVGEEGVLSHLDALLVPDGAEYKKRGLTANGVNTGLTKAFLARGGKIVTWGKPAAELKKLGANVIETKDGAAAIEWLRTFAASPAPAPDVVKIEKVPNPKRVAYYIDKGGAGYPVAEAFEFSPEFQLDIVSAEDIRNGALKGAALAVQPGGSCNSQYMNLKEAGQNAIRDYVRGGGSYYGICAGAFLATESVPTRGRLGLVPWRDDQEKVYRGWCKINVDFTEEGRAALGFKEKERMILYWGGPVMEPGDPLPDTDVKVFGTYAGRMINTCQPKDIKPMNGKAAFLGGRVGKGKVFVSAIHPEKHQRTFDIVNGAIGFLTGTKPTQRRRDRVRGALTVACESETDKTTAQFLLQRLMHDRRFDLMVGDVTASVREHADVVLLLRPAKGEYGKSLQQFVANGGQVIALANTPARQAVVEKFAPGVTVATSYDDVMEKLAARRASAQKR